MTRLLQTMFAATLMLGAAASAHAQLITKKALSLDAAKRIAMAAEDHARKNNWNVVIAILDDGGNLVYLQRMDGVQIGSILVAQRKAESAIKFKRPTKAMSDAVSGRPQIMMLPGSLAIEGGLPLMAGNEIVGAIGVSGVTSEQDGLIAKAGADVMQSLK